MNAKDHRYNRHCREMGWRPPDWRMGSLSEDGWDNITQLERGPQGPGEVDRGQWPHTLKWRIQLTGTASKGGAN